MRTGNKPRKIRKLKDFSNGDKKTQRIIMVCSIIAGFLLWALISSIPSIKDVPCKPGSGVACAPFRIGRRRKVLEGPRHIAAKSIHRFRTGVCLRYPRSVLNGLVFQSETDHRALGSVLQDDTADRAHTACNTRDGTRRKNLSIRSYSSPPSLLWSSPSIRESKRSI